jgi:protein-tyrosine-phosphatase
MSEKVFNVLFICTGNSARSILAEGLMTSLGRGRFKAYSAGSHPTRTVHPMALSTLAKLHVPSEGFRSKNWDDFAQPGAPEFDFIFTVCDNAAGEICPIWPGQPMTAHWGVADPAAAQGSDVQKARAFMDAAVLLKRRIELMLSLPMSTLTGLSLQSEIDRIGRTGG